MIRMVGISGRLLKKLTISPRFSFICVKSTACRRFSMDKNTTFYPDVFLLSRLPNLDQELRNVLPSNVKLRAVRVADQRLKWDKSINLSDAEVDALKNAEVLVCDSMFLAKMLYRLPQVKWAQSTWTGVEMIFEEFDKTRPHPNFQLTRYVDPYFCEQMSNYVMAQIINIERGFYVYQEKQKTSEWARPYFPNFRVLSQLCVGILGAGTLGSAVGRHLKYHGTNILAFVKNVREGATDDYDKASTNLEDILSQCDYLCNILPSTEQTRGLLDDEALKMCKKKPVFINIGRGDIIKEESIIKALKCGWISQAILDVFKEEPLPASSALWRTPGVIITPHVGAMPRIDGSAKFIAENYRRYVEGEELLNKVAWNQGY